MMRIVGVLLVAAAFAVGLYFVGWVTVPMVAAIYAVGLRRRRAPAEAMLGAMLASLALLVPHAITASFPRLLEQLGAIFPMPGVAVLGLTVLLHMILAFTSARVAIGVVGTREPSVVRLDAGTVRVAG